MIILNRIGGKLMNGKIGLLWYNPKLMQDYDKALDEVRDYYYKKYNRSGSVTVYVNPSCVKETKLQGITIKATRSVLPNHIWIGQED
jgi:hypothetical protein